MATKGTSSKKGASVKRMFVLDTNVLIHDPTAIFNFAEHDVVIPITVLEELDRLKSGNESKNISAREVSRTLRKLITEGSGGPISLGKNLGMLSFKSAVLSKEDPVSHELREDSADNRIIAAAYNLHKQGESVTLVTKDNNMAVKAYALGIRAEDYTHDMVKDMSCFEEKIREVDVEDVNDPHPETLKLSLYVNQAVCTKANPDGGNRIFRWSGKNFNLISRKEIGKTGIKAKNLEQDFAVDILMDKKLSAVALVGSAGSGKTLLTVASAIAQKANYERILVARPAVELSDKTLGFLPGTLDEKYDPYLAPIRSACRILIDKAKTKEPDTRKWMTEQGIELLPLSFIRGETYHHSFIIVDESQNLTPNEVKTIVSRAGEGTKVVFTGDINQIDMQYLSKETNGLSHLIDRFCGQDYFAYIEMEKSVRSPLAEAADKML